MLEGLRGTGRSRPRAIQHPITLTEGGGDLKQKRDKMNWLIQSLWATMLPVLLIIASASPAKAMTDIEALAVYGVDMQVCNLHVPRTYIDPILIRASVENNATPRQVAEVAADLAQVLEGNIRDSGRLVEYCTARRMK